MHSAQGNSVDTDANLHNHVFRSVKSRARKAIRILDPLEEDTEAPI